MTLATCYLSQHEALRPDSQHSTLRDESVRQPAELPLVSGYQYKINIIYTVVCKLYGKYTANSWVYGETGTILASYYNFLRLVFSEFDCHDDNILDILERLDDTVF